MGRYGLLLYCALLVLAYLSPTARAQSSTFCDAGRKNVPPEEEIDESIFGALVTLPLPPVCQDFAYFQLGACIEQLNMEECCCDQGCISAFAQLGDACVKEYGAQLCGTPDMAHFARAMLRAANRCTVNKEQLSCESLTGSPGENVTNASFCDPGKKSVPPEEQIDENIFGAFVILPEPPTCQPSAYLQWESCTDQFNIEEGCCDQLCISSFAQLGEQCVKDYGVILCSIPQVEHFGRSMLRAANRCMVIEEKLSCESLTGSPSLQSTSEEPKPESAAAETESPTPVPAIDCDEMTSPIEKLECVIDGGTPSG